VCRVFVTLGGERIKPTVLKVVSPLGTDEKQRFAAADLPLFNSQAMGTGKRVTTTDVVNDRGVAVVVGGICWVREMIEVVVTVTMQSECSWAGALVAEKNDYEHDLPTD
jgi:hypothetical protein